MQLTRTMPTKADVPEIRTIAETYSGDIAIISVTATSGGVLVRYDRRLYSNNPAPALDAVGYTTTSIREGLLLVTGAVDQLALLDAQIAALTERRAALAAATWRCTACATYTPTAREICDTCGYTREGHDTVGSAA
ncbi:MULTISPECIES: hypothetical protein [unclassified Nocardiopsis]|uniref:hypothetical protein n=1 Tax=unclassified Nocardiopsis TaxID=2649073 RepID=UPI001359BF46|nr:MULTISPECIES: hypothetical protein [unclassified Nocardiopsis]